MIESILFDIDGTLVDSNNFHVLAWAEAFHAAGHDFRLQQIHDQIGQGADNFVAALIPGASDAEAERLGSEQVRLFKQHYVHRLKPFPGAHDLIARCKAEGYRVALATSASAEVLDHHLDLLGVRDLVDSCTTADDVGASKPSPDIFTTALEKLATLDVDWLDDGDRMHLNEAADRAARMTEELEAIRERAALLHEQLTDLRAETIDTRSLVIAVVAMVFLPLTFLTGLVGMNVPIPFAQVPYIFEIIVGGCIALSAAIAVYFTRARWF